MMRRLFALVLVGMLVGCGSTNPPLTDREALSRYVEGAPGVPLVLPETLPERYTFLGPGFQRAEGSRIVVRTSEYQFGQAEQSGVITLCLIDVGGYKGECVEPGDKQMAISRRYTMAWFGAAALCAVAAAVSFGIRRPVATG